MRRAVYHEGRCDALVGTSGEDRALGNYSQALEEVAIAEYVHADKVIDTETSMAYRYEREAVVGRSTEWLMQQHQSLAHDPDAQDEVAERLVEREDEGEDLSRQGRYAVQQARGRIVTDLMRTHGYSEAEAQESLSGWFGQRPDEGMSRAQRAGVTEKQVRAAYEDHVAFEYQRAHQEISASLLSRRGQAAGVSAEALFRGSLAQVESYASEELRAYWARHGRLTWGAFRYELLSRDSDRTAHTRAKTNLPDDVAMVGG